MKIEITGRGTFTSSDAKFDEAYKYGRPTLLRWAREIYGANNAKSLSKLRKFELAAIIADGWSEDDRSFEGCSNACCGRNDCGDCP